MSHRSAAYLYELLPHPAKPGPIDVTVTRRHRGRYDAIALHRATLAPHEIRERHGLPVTAPIRTLVDLAGAEPDELEQAVAEAFARRLTSLPALKRAVSAYRGRRGVAQLRALLDVGVARTRSAPERVLLDAIRAAHLPEPLANHRIGPWETDLHWPDHALVVEVDGYAAHSSPWAFDRDRRKDAELRSRGLTVQRFSANAVRDDLAAVVAWVADAVG